MVAEFNRQMTSKTGYVAPELFSSMGWDDFINEYRNDSQNYFEHGLDFLALTLFISKAKNRPEIKHVFVINMHVIYSNRFHITNIKPVYQN